MLRVVSLGNLVNDPRYINRGSNPYPVGYSVEVPVFATSTKSAPGAAAKVLFPGDETDSSGHVAEVYYTASIRQRSDDSPLFEVKRSDVPNVSFRGDNPSKPWRDAFAAAERDFSDRLSTLNRPVDAKGQLKVSGVKCFGLTNTSVVEQVKKLPGWSSVFSEAKTNADTEDNKEETSSGMIKEKAKGRLSGEGNLKGKKGSLLSKGDDGHGRVKRSRGRPANKQKYAKFTDDSDITTIDDSCGNEDDDDDVPVISLCRSMSSVSSPASPTYSLCPLCGLTGTPFCALTGQPHIVKKRGRVARLSTNTIDSLGTPEKPKRQRRKRSSPDANDPGSNNSVDGKKPVGRKQKGKSAQDVSSETGRKRKRQQTIDELTKKPKLGEADTTDDEPSLADIMRQKMRSEKKTGKTLLSSLPPPPFWRPPLDAKESSKAGLILQRILRDKSLLEPPFVNALRVPMVPIKNHLVKGGKKQTAASLQKKNGNRRKGKVEGEGTEVEEEEEDEEEENNEQQEQQQQKHSISNEDGEDGVANVKEEGLPEEKNLDDKQDLRKEKHPLEITDMANSIAGKRYTRFMQMYTSERTKMDLLRKADIVLPLPRGPQPKRGAPRRNAKEKKPAAESITEDPVIEVEE